MKKLIIILFLPLLFAVSCRTKADNIGVSSDRKNYSETLPGISPTPESNQQDINLKIGIVDGNIENICFRTKNGYLMENTAVSIVTSLYERPQKVLGAVVEKKLKEICSRRASESTDQNPGENFYYSLNLTEKDIDEYQEVFGIGVIELETSFRFQNGLAGIDLNNDEKSEYFRTCTGSESVFFAIWTGKPLEGKQIWHSVYYLDYGTEPTCTKRDYEGTVGRDNS